MIQIYFGTVQFLNEEGSLNKYEIRYCNVYIEFVFKQQNNV